MAFRKPGEGSAYYQANKERINANSRSYRQRAKAERPWLVALKSTKLRARERGLHFSLSDEWARSVWTGACAMTGIEFVVDMSGATGPKPLSATIDRINANAGYTPDNCRFVLSCVNNFRGTLGDAEMLRVAAAIVTHDRDVNAARNILRRGLATLVEGASVQRRGAANKDGGVSFVPSKSGGA